MAHPTGGWPPNPTTTGDSHEKEINDAAGYDLGREGLYPRDGRNYKPDSIDSKPPATTCPNNSTKLLPEREL
jgi:hypothetical protein